MTIVGIVGGGIGGSAAAYFLREHLRDNVKIDLYEKSSRIGGRVYSVPFAGHKFESGASIIHPKNRYAVDLSAKFGLEKKDGMGAPGVMGISDGNQFVFTESSYSFVTIAKLLFRYGFSLLKMRGIVNRMLDSFDLIYFWQMRQEKSFDDLKSLLKAMDLKFPDSMKISLREYLKSEFELTGKLVDELIEAITLVNYGQSVDDVHGFTGAVSIAGGDPNLWSIKNGNEQLPQEMASRSDARILLKTEVTKISSADDNKYQITDSNNNHEVYDYVIIAHPLNPGSTIDFTGIKDQKILKNIITERNSRGKFHQTIATFVSGAINADVTGGNPSMSSVIICDKDSFYYSISRLTPVNVSKDHVDMSGAPPVYKVFSRNVLTDDQLGYLFSRIDEMKSINWKAYPEYNSFKYSDDSSSHPKFKLGPGLFYTNSIEFSASAMEMSIISGHNSALLVKQHFKTAQKIPKVDGEKIKSDL